MSDEAWELEAYPDVEASEAARLEELRTEIRKASITGRWTNPAPGVERLDEEVAERINAPVTTRWTRSSHRFGIEAWRPDDIRVHTWRDEQKFMQVITVYVDIDERCESREIHLTDQMLATQPDPTQYTLNCVRDAIVHIYRHALRVSFR